MNPNRIKKLLQHLSDQINSLAQAVARQKDVAWSVPRFDHQLFQEKGTRLTDYLQEIQQNYQQMSQLTAEGQTDRLNWLAEHVVRQISALQREIATLSLRSAPARPRTRGAAQGKYHHIHRTQQRLQKEIATYEYQLGRVETLAQQQQLQRKIVMLEGQLSRCQKTLLLFGPQQIQ